jgi:hypothetical protein
MSQLDDAEQLVAQSWEAKSQQTGNLLKLTLPPHPAMPLQRKEEARSGCSREQNQRANPAGRFRKSVSNKDRQVRQYETEQSSERTFGQLDELHSSLELKQPLSDARGQLDAVAV